MTANYPKHSPDLFWLVVGLMALAALLTSCSNDFYCSKCVTHTKETITIHDTTIVRDTVIKIDERTITIRDTVPCNDFELNKDSNGVKIQVLVKDKVIYVKATCAALELKLRLYDRLRTITKTTELTRYVTTRKKSNWWIWLLVGIGVGYLTPKILNLTGKLPFKL